MPVWEHRVLVAGVDYGYHSAAEREKLTHPSQATAGFLQHPPNPPAGAAEMLKLPLLEEVLQGLGREGWTVCGLSAATVIVIRRLE